MTMDLDFSVKESEPNDFSNKVGSLEKLNMGELKPPTNGSIFWLIIYTALGVFIPICAVWCFRKTRSILGLLLFDRNMQ